MDTLVSLRRETTCAVVIADEDGLITYVNERFERDLGWNREEILGRPLLTIIPPRLHDAHHLGFSRFLLTGVSTLLDRPLTLSVMTREGKEVRAEHRILAEQVQGHWVFGATIRRLDAEEEPWDA